MCQVIVGKIFIEEKQSHLELESVASDAAGLDRRAWPVVRRRGRLRNQATRQGDPAPGNSVTGQSQQSRLFDPHCVAGSWCLRTGRICGLTKIRRRGFKETSH